MMIVIPFLIYHTIFVFYTNMIYEHRKYDVNYELANWVFAIALLGFSLYFLYNEFRQMNN